MDIFTSHTIQDITKAEWTAMVGPNSIEQSYDWLKTVEHARVLDMQYLFIRERGSLKAAAYCFPMKESLFLWKIPLLEVWSPLTPSSSFFSRDAVHTRALLDGLERLRQTTKTLGFTIMGLKRDQWTLLRDHSHRLTHFSMRENTYLDLPFSDFDDYLASLENGAWRSARMTLNRARRWKIKTVFTTELGKWGAEANRLQEFTCKAHNDYQWFLPRDFYNTLEQYMKDTVELLLFFKDDTVLASAVVLNTPNVCYYRFPGIDPRYRKYQAYFLMYYEGIRRAIERKQSRIYFGLSGYTFKERIGCKKEELFGASRMKNPLLNLGLKAYMAIIRKRG
jgi:predicted N-acyltransferase